MPAYLMYYSRRIDFCKFFICYRGGPFLSLPFLSSNSVTKYVHGAARISGHSIIKIRNFNPIKLISRQNYLPMGWTFSPKFHNDWVKIADFFIKSLFLGLLSFFCISLYIKSKNTSVSYNLNNSDIIWNFWGHIDLI